MHKIFRTTGKLRTTKDAKGGPVESKWEWPVIVDAKYLLKPSPHQPLVLDIYGYDLLGFGQCIEELVLDNGVTISGRTIGGSWDFNTGKLRKVRMFDTQERILHLYPARADTAGSPEIDAVVFGIVSSEHLGSNGWARPGLPFSYVEGQLPECSRNVTWSSQAQRIVHGDFQITFVATSGYWKQLVDKRSLHHEMICGIRKDDGSVIDWDSVIQLMSVLSKFIGWVNHCVSPVYHIKAYRKGRLVYRGYDLYPHPTVERDRIPWLGDPAAVRNRETVQRTFGAFSNTWIKYANEGGVFHLALQFLRSKERGSFVPGVRPSLFYLRDTFSAVSILTSILAGSDPRRGRYDTMVKCVKKLKIPDQLPVDDARERLKQEFPDLWRSSIGRRSGAGTIKENERARGQLCRPMANVENWLLHLDDSANAERLLSLGDYQAYFVEVSIWLADLMLMKVVGHRGVYFNRLTGRNETLPWEG